jgi:enamine deaminase RidA (YjgF/YER057c/UK114 family)
MPLTIVNPDTLVAPRGFAHGVLTEGRCLHLAGQIGCDVHGQVVSPDLVAQFAQALDNLLAVMAAAGAGPERLARLTGYVTDMPEYRRRRRELAPVWRARLGRHYPAMALVGVTALVDPAASVELEGVALL